MNTFNHIFADERAHEKECADTARTAVKLTANDDEIGARLEHSRLVGLAGDRAVYFIQAELNRLKWLVVDMWGSTPLDIAPPVDDEMSPAAFLQLVRDYKIRVDTPNGDSSRVHIARVVGLVTVIGWDYEGPVDGVMTDMYGDLSIRPDTQPLRDGDTISIGMEKFTITQEP